MDQTLDLMPLIIHLRFRSHFFAAEEKKTINVANLSQKKQNFFPELLVEWLD